MTEAEIIPLAAPLIITAIVAAGGLWVRHRILRKYAAEALTSTDAEDDLLDIREGEEIVRSGRTGNETEKTTTIRLRRDRRELRFYFGADGRIKGVRTVR